jgi:hypothetical protein
MMIFGVSPLHTSVPADGRHAAEGGTRHVVVVCMPELASERFRSHASFGGAAAELLCVGPAPEDWPQHATTVAYDAEQLESLLRERLASAHVGVRLHLAGPEAFVRRMTAIGLEEGLLAEEIGVDCDPAQPAFRVFCVHCRTVTKPVAETLARCAGCGRTLTVYHHFSRRKGAFMGFQADAELAGELPAATKGRPCP